jgi:hypothetical protein
MESTEKNTVWVLSPAGTIRSTTEAMALELIHTSASYENYIFFYANLTPIEDET